VLVDALLLARCDHLVHAQSNVAAFAAYTNPALQLHYLGHQAAFDFAAEHTGEPTERLSFPFQLRGQADSAAAGAAVAAAATELGVSGYVGRTTVGGQSKLEGVAVGGRYALFALRYLLYTLPPHHPPALVETGTTVWAELGATKPELQAADEGFRLLGAAATCDTPRVPPLPVAAWAAGQAALAPDAGWVRLGTKPTVLQVSGVLSPSGCEALVQSSCAGLEDVLAAGGEFSAIEPTEPVLAGWLGGNSTR
jgi:hypothetical protein